MTSHRRHRRTRPRPVLSVLNYRSCVGLLPDRPYVFGDGRGLFQQVPYTFGGFGGDVFDCSGWMLEHTRYVAARDAWRRQHPHRKWRANRRAAGFTRTGRRRR
ncbi:MAG: hypothetical protein QM582_10105 [Micropruina sp.]|uniref:hypothetical protein n=1 Tax=Micropruina sp. TaxID=2737536 RepID=UPI0039E5E48F